MLDLLKSVTEREDEQVAAELRRIAVVQPPPFVTQLLETERPKAIDLALDRSCVHQPCLGGRHRGDLPLRFGRLSVRHAINAFIAGLFRSKRQTELLAHHGRKEAADRVLLPAGRHHDGGDGCALGLSEQGEDRLLLGPAAGRTRGRVPQARRAPSRGCWRGKLGLCGGFAMRHFEILFGCGGVLRRHHRSPTVAACQRGKIPDRATGPYLGMATVTLPSPRKSTPFCDEN